MESAQLFHDGTGTGCLRLSAQAHVNDIPSQLVVCALDTSGSMVGPKLAAAKRAVQFCLTHLRPNVDRLALITFDEQAEVRIPPTIVTDDNREQLTATVAAIRPGGSTHLSAGLVLALAQVPAGGTGHLILATDGRPNLGVCDTAALAALVVEHARGKTVRLDTAGFGADHDDALLCALAQQGVYTFLEHAEGICDWAATRLGHLLSTVAHDIRVELQGATQLRAPAGWTVSGGTVQLPQLAAEARKHVLFQHTEAVSGTVTYCDTAGAEHTLALGPAVRDAALVAEQQQRWLFVDVLVQARQLAEQQLLHEARTALETAIAELTDGDMREQLTAMLALYSTTACYRSLGRQRSTEAARGYAMEEETGGRAAESLFTTSTQRTLRRAAAVVWQWENDPVGSEAYVDFDPALQRSLQDAHAAGQAQLGAEIGGTSYTLHLDACVQVNNHTQFVRQIRHVRT
jgi:uncharacterized protein YegL